MSKVTQIYPRLGGLATRQGKVSDKLVTVGAEMTTEQLIALGDQCYREAAKRDGWNHTVKFYRERNEVYVTSRKSAAATEAEVWFAHEGVVDLPLEDPPLDPREGMNELPGC